MAGGTLAGVEDAAIRQLKMPRGVGGVLVGRVSWRATDEASVLPRPRSEPTSWKADPIKSLLRVSSS